jgi:hypothetical protein
MIRNSGKDVRDAGITGFSNPTNKECVSALDFCMILQSI